MRAQDLYYIVFFGGRKNPASINKKQNLKSQLIARVLTGKSKRGINES